MEETGLYEIFEDMLRSLIVNRPEDPVKYLIDKFEKPESKSPLTFTAKFKLQTEDLWLVSAVEAVHPDRILKFLTSVTFYS